MGLEREGGVKVIPGSVTLALGQAPRRLWLELTFRLVLANPETPATGPLAQGGSPGAPGSPTPSPPRLSPLGRGALGCWGGGNRAQEGD